MCDNILDDPTAKRYSMDHHHLRVGRTVVVADLWIVMPRADYELIIRVDQGNVTRLFRKRYTDISCWAESNFHWHLFEVEMLSYEAAQRVQSAGRSLPLTH